MPNLRAAGHHDVAAAALPRSASSRRCPPAADFEPLMTLYLTDNTSADEIARAKASGLRARGQVLPGRRHDELRFRRHVARPRHIRRSRRWSATASCCRCTAKSPIADVDVFDRERVFVERHLATIVRDFPGAAHRARARHDARGRAVRRRRALARCGDDHAAAPALFAQRAVRRRPAAASLLPAGAQARNASAGARGGGDVGQPEILPRHRLRAARARHQGEQRAAARAATRRRSRCRSMRKRSRMPGRSTGSKALRACTARRSTACRATAIRSRLRAEPGRCRRRSHSAQRASCRCAPGRRCGGRSSDDARSGAGPPIMAPRSQPDRRCPGRNAGGEESPGSTEQDAG